eukprot:7229835-Karenia_brevis.AAC.1
MAENMVTMQNPNTSTSVGSKSSVPQWFDMEAPGGVGVAEKPKVPMLQWPSANESKSSDVVMGKDASSAPSGGACGGGGGGGGPNTRSKEADNITLESLPTVPKFPLWKSS